MRKTSHPLCQAWKTRRIRRDMHVLYHAKPHPATLAQEKASRPGWKEMCFLEEKQYKNIQFPLDISL